MLSADIMTCLSSFVEMCSKNISVNTFCIIFYRNSNLSWLRCLPREKLPYVSIL
jgi:hypothetical protein